MITYLTVFGCGCLFGAVTSGFFWAQFIYSNTKKHAERESDVR